MNILHVVSLYGPYGGAETYLLSLKPLLERMGHVVSVAYGTRHPDLGSAPGPHEHRLDETVPAPLLAENIAAIAERESADVVHYHKVFYLLELLCSPELREKIPAVVHAHGYRLTCPDGARFQGRPLAPCRSEFGVGCVWSAFARKCASRRPRLLLQNYRRTRNAVHSGLLQRRILVASEFVRRCLAKNGYRRDRISVLPYFTSLNGCAFDARPEPGVLLFVGRIIRLKGLEVLIRALSECRTRPRLLVAGDGRGESGVRALCEELGVADRVEFLGWVSDAECSRLYDRAGIVLVPSLWDEPFGIVGIEAMAHRRPVIASNSGGIPEWLQHRRNGFLVEPGNVTELAARTDELIADPSLARRMGREGRRICEQRYTPQTHVNRLLRIYQDAISEFQEKAP